MTKKEVMQKIKKILAKDPSFKDVKITVAFRDKKEQGYEKKSL